MSKPIKALIQKELAGKVKGIDSLAVVEITGVDAIANNKLRSRLLKKNINLLVIKNSIARQAFKSVGLEKAAELLEGPCALAWGGDGVITVVRELLEIQKDVQNLKVKAAMLEGDLFKADRIQALSRYPTRQEAVAQLVSAIISPASSLVSCIIAPAGSVAALLKAVEEKKEKEAPAAAAPAPAAQAASVAPTA
ncbi:MAG: 50S ribosomal protein L10 [Planctomycetes bacterium]|nr:50S ribosomal protein L10 [Planctomycetota bacterium]